MNIFLLLILITLLGYAILIIRFIVGWEKLPDFESTERNVSTSVAIVTACKNEKLHLPFLLKAIQAQTYSNFQHIVVDDDSTDGSWTFARDYQYNFTRLKVLQNEGVGKKEALKTAIEQTDAELIVTLDADCRPKAEWLETIVEFYERENADLVICPVRMSTDRSFLQNFQQFDFTSLVGSGAGAVGAGMPILCNGANLAFRRQVWLDSLDELHFEEPSGDDIFLLQSVKRRGGVIRFLKSKTATVVTRPKASWKAFFQQRQRWAGKKTAYTDWQLSLTAVLVFMTGFMVLLNLILAVFKQGFWMYSILFFLLKWLIDFVFFRQTKDFFELKNVTGNSFLISLAYPFYIVYAAITSFITGSNRNW
ncbi:MAG: glycosyltransferase [Paludibacteraceae bacterium]